MAQAKNAGNGKLEEALAALAQQLQQQQQQNQQQLTALMQLQATLMQNQAAFLARAAETDARLNEMERANSERFARIEALLLEHNRILQALPDVIRDKIGFKPSAP